MSTSEAKAGPEESGSEAQALGGRPRDPALDQRILGAVRSLLAERGYQALSVQEVTRRSSVHVRTITRRWPTKGELVAAAIFYNEDEPTGTGDPALPTGDLRADLTQIIQGTLDYLSDPAVRAAMPALWAEMRSNAGVRELIDLRRTQLTALVEEVLALAVTSESAPPHVVDHAAEVATVLAGAAFGIESTSAPVLDDGAVSGLVGLLVAGLFALDS
jgi:AcrR family transcriptional regulator